VLESCFFLVESVFEELGAEEPDSALPSAAPAFFFLP
jgi:hypothetical protein